MMEHNNGSNTRKFTGGLNNSQNSNRENCNITKEESNSETESPNGHNNPKLIQVNSFIQKKDIIALVGDIGGTNCRFMLVNCTKDLLIDRLKILIEKRENY